jgi:hypothetical protein
MEELDNPRGFGLASRFMANTQWRPPTIPKGWTATKRIYGYWELNCPHGVGHPDPRDPNLNCDGIHGCDGCCSQLHKLLDPTAENPNLQNP